jgi:K(+)-stimulated pyrophosphate-energized sodium pump
MLLVMFALATGVLAILAVVYLILSILREPSGTKEMREVAGFIRSGMNAFIKTQYRTTSLLVILIAVILAVFFRNARIVSSFVFGSILSLAAGYVGMRVAVEANVRAANAARTNIKKAFSVAFSGGAVMGISVVGFSLTGVTLLYLLFGDPRLIVSFGFGASFAALFAQLGGGIFTKAADIGADLVGKIEQNMPEDDLRNPAVIADLVGDNVGDCAGRGSDLFESISDDFITAMILGTIMFGVLGNAVVFPLLLGAVGALATLIGVFFIRVLRRFSATATFNMGLLLTAGCCLTGTFVCSMLFGGITIFLATASGLLASLIVGYVAQYYTRVKGKPTGQVVSASEGGPALNIIAGLTYAFQSPFVPMLTVLVTVLFSYYVTGGSIYGIVAANIGSDLAIGIIMSSDAFGPISDNASGIMKMAKVNVGNTLEDLDTLGNTMKAYTKAFATASGTISTIVLFFTYAEITGWYSANLSLLSPVILVGLMLGASLPFMFSSTVIGATGKTASRVVEDVRKQFRENPDILAGKVCPDYSRCVELATKKSLKKIVWPSLIAVVFPILVGLILGKYALGALLLGGLSTSALLSPCFTFGGGIWDNAKKRVESSGERGTPTHEATVIGDTVGDVLKDVAGPSLNIFMKLMNMTALLIVPFLLML